MEKRIAHKFTLRNKLVFIVVSSIISIVSLLMSDKLAHELKRKEVNEINLWSLAMTKSSDDPMRNYKLDSEEMILEILNNNDDIPRIVTDGYLNIVSFSNISERVYSDPKKMKRMIEKLANKNIPLEVNVYNGMYLEQRYIFYGDSVSINMLRFFPFISLVIVLVFVSFSYITYNSSKQDEQNKVWIGMAKETAHQLGTPTTSLLGWIEYLRSMGVEPMAVDEMDKDIKRLLVVVDRFSKIGSRTVLEPINITEVVNNTVSYFQKRLPKKVTLTSEILYDIPLVAHANEVLFGWVIENLLRNSTDALEGAGSIHVTAYMDNKWIYVDVKDTGKGIAPNNVEMIFKPGFTTKSRGWGLGLSLCHRIIVQYHMGRIFVAHSELGKGTTIRIMINKI